MLQARDVRVVRGDAEVLKRVSLTVSPGQLVAVVGPGGAGKSTLLNVLSGSVTPEMGSVCLDHYPLVTWTPRALARRRAVLPQLQELSFAFGALEVVLLGLSPYLGTSTRQDDLRVARECLAETGAEQLAERNYTTLSPGERERVQLARVLAQVHLTQPGHELAGRYLLLDEPGYCLDPADRHATLAVIRRSVERGIGAVVALQDLNLAAMYGDRVMILAGGMVLADGLPGEVLTEPAVRHALGVPPVVLRLVPSVTTALLQ